MDPVSLVTFLAIAWFIRAAFEDGYATVRGQESPRIARRRARQQLAHQHAAVTGRPTIGQAVVGRVADRIAERRPIGPFRQYLAELWNDSWEDAATRHEERRRKRAERAEREREQERERAEREADGRPDPDNAVRTRRCLDCPVLVVVPAERCDDCEDRLTGWSDDDSQPEPQDNEIHYCAGGCGLQVGDPGFWCAGCRYHRGPECADGCGNKVAISGMTCPTCIRRANGDHLDDHQVEELNDEPDDDQPPETPEPDPDPDTTRKDTPVSTPEINGDVTSPLAALAFADGCLDLNAAIMNELDAMASNLDGEGVGAACVQIVRDAWAAGDQFTAAATGARDQFASHVATQAEIAGDEELRDTVAGTYLDAARA